MTDILKCTLIQTQLLWEDVEGNLDRLTSKIIEVKGASDLIVLPEMFTTGFSMTPKHLAEEMTGRTVEWMKNVADESHATIMGSCIIQVDGNYFNRFISVDFNGEVTTYDKKHLFTLAGESDEYTCGSEPLLLNINGWKIRPLICYDLRFPVWSRSRKTVDSTYEYDLLVYVANWPTPRINAWDTLLKARAIENQSYCIGVNRLGMDGNKLEYPGHSIACDFGGNLIEDLQSEDATRTVSLSMELLNKFRNQFGFQEDGDPFTLH